MAVKSSLLTKEPNTKALRQIKLTKKDQPDLEELKEYIAEAIQLQKDGKK